MNEEQPAPDELAALFGFTLEELALNRAGRLSDRQRQNLFFLSVGYLVRGLALVVLNLALATAVAHTVHTAVQRIAFVALCLLMAGIAVFLLRAAYTVAFPTVRIITGALQRSGDARHPSVRAGDDHLRIAFRRWKRLKDSYPGQYRFYIAPALILLSLEALNRKG